jgi:protein O-GlcNAc transferase
MVAAMAPPRRSAQRTADALVQTGLAHHQAGRFAEAEAAYRKALGHAPGHADARHLVGLVAFQSGRVAESLPDLAAAAAAAPMIAAYQADHALAAMSLGRLPEAGAALRRALGAEPANANAWSMFGMLGQSTRDYAASVNRVRRNAAIEAASPAAQVALGTLLAAVRDPRGAITAFAKAVALDGSLREPRLKLAGLHQELGEPLEALRVYDDGLARDGLSAELHNNRGNLLLALQRRAEAVPAFRRAAALSPALGAIYNNLGNALMTGPLQEEAGATFRRALALQPDLAEASNGLGRWLSDRERYPEAIAALEGALAARPMLGEFHSNLAAALRTSGDIDRATRHARIALALGPRLPEAHNNMAAIVLTVGDAVSAVSWYRRTLALVPSVLDVHRNLLASLLYVADLAPQAAFDEHLRFAAKFALPADETPFANDRSPGRQLTIGYLSSDLRHHPIARNVWPWLSERDRARFRAVVFADVQKPDHVTAQLKGLSDEWHSVLGLTDAEVAALIRARGVDVLVILGGHFDRNRPLVAALRPAPVVISAHDGATSGVPGMGYLIADPTVAPHGGPERFSERVIRVPVFAIQRPIDGAPEIGPAPARAAGRVTFGSFNNPSKITPDTIRLWSGVLNAVPNSRLMLKYRNTLSSAGLRARLQRLFLAYGVEPDRIAMVSAAGQADAVGAHLALYNHIDIALDTAPFNGSTTTFEALWMGVPVVTLLGRTMMSRWAASMLVRVGRGHWVATDEAGYVARAAEWSRDLDGLDALRRTLRGEVGMSRLCRTGPALRHLERVYRALWRRWCRGDGISA